MPTDTERREVAAMLRKEGRALTAIDVGAELASLTLDDAIGIEHNVTWEECFNRLADLIDPCPSMADEQMGKLRRRSTALASMTRIASDMSGWAGELADSCERMSRARIADDVRRFADRIRQEARDALN
jgi:hypothetical protein